VNAQQIVDTMLNEGWDGTPGWHLMQADHEVTTRYNPKSPTHAAIAKDPNPGNRVGAYIGHLDDMGQVTHHLVNMRPKKGRPKYV
jgi:hypothetical protein